MQSCLSTTPPVNEYIILKIKHNDIRNYLLNRKIVFNFPSFGKAVSALLKTVQVKFCQWQSKVVMLPCRREFTPIKAQSKFI